MFEHAVFVVTFKLRILLWAWYSHGAKPGSTIRTTNGPGWATKNECSCAKFDTTENDSTVDWDSDAI